MLCPSNPFDGHTLAESVASVEKTTGVSVNQIYVDKSYRGHNYKGEATVQVASSSNRRVSESMKRRRKRRSAIDPKIGHLKSENRLGRCYLRGLKGDQINVILAAAGSNLRKLLRALAPALKNWLVCWLSMMFWSAKITLFRICERLKVPLRKSLLYSDRNKCSLSYHQMPLTSFSGTTT
jgi:transposase, IS5 family